MVSSPQLDLFHSSQEEGGGNKKNPFKNAGKCNGSLQREREREQVGEGRAPVAALSWVCWQVLPGVFMRISQVWVSKWLGEGLCWVFSGLGAAGEPWWGQAELGVHRVPGSCAVPVSTEIEMKENFLSHCPSSESKRERNREREREKDFPQGSAVIKRLSFEKQ